MYNLPNDNSIPLYRYLPYHNTYIQVLISDNSMKIKAH